MATPTADTYTAVSGAVVYGGITVADTTPPAWGGSALAGSDITSTGYTLAASGAATDAVGVTGYRYRINGGAWVYGSGYSFAVTGRTASTTDSCDMQARDAAGNWSASISCNVTLSAPGFGATLDLILAAPAESWIKLNAGMNTLSSQFPTSDLANGSLGPSDSRRIQGAWPSFGWDSNSHRLVIWGGGHANAAVNEVYEWRADDRQWHMAFYPSEMVQVGSAPRYRSSDFNSTPVSSHTYGNNNYLTVLDRFFTFGGGAYGDGGVLGVYNASVPGYQSPLRAAGCYTLDMTQAGTGKMAGATGSNRHVGAYASTDIPGADAWQLRDWFGQAYGHASRPSWFGSNFDQHINCGTAATVEGGKDVLYYSAGSGTPRHLIRVVFTDSNPVNDVQTYICAQGVDNPGARGQGPIAIDTVRRVVIKNNGPVSPTAGNVIEFCDLKRTWGATNGWRFATLAGADLAEFLAVSLMNAGMVYNPIKGCFVIWAMGRQVWEIYPPDSAAYIDNSNANLTADTGWSVVKAAMDTGSTAPRSTYVSDPNLGETGTLGKFRWADDMRCAVATFGNADGEVWAYKPAGWTDPR